jgi:polysaccharide deacetylase family protein (PEP-CTERM system associated)
MERCGPVSSFRCHFNRLDDSDSQHRGVDTPGFLHAHGHESATALRGQLQVQHHFTVDVEEHFQVSALEPYVPRARWEHLPSRVVASTDLLLDLMAETGARGTFFTLGWVAERHPDLVRRIARGGHEVASHGWGHQRITTLTREEFRDDVRRSKEILEQIAGVPVLGYRAPSFSIVPGREWALETLVEEGYVYDSSLYPVARNGYGYPGGRRDPHWLDLEAGRLYEVPPSTLHLWGRTVPAGGGAYFRLLPYGLTRAALSQAARRGQPGTFYIHPWELDPGQPRFPVSRLTRIRHYGALSSTARRIERLLREFRFVPIAEAATRELTAV